MIYIVSGVEGKWLLHANSSTLQRALGGVLHSKRVIITLVDVMLALAGTTLSIAACRSFIDWFKGPLDSAAVTAIGIVVASIASICWFVRFMLRETVLRSAPAAGRTRESEVG